MMRIDLEILAGSAFDTLLLSANVPVIAFVKLRP